MMLFPWQHAVTSDMNIYRNPNALVLRHKSSKTSQDVLGLYFSLYA